MCPMMPPSARGSIFLGEVTWGCTTANRDIISAHLFFPEGQLHSLRGCHSTVGDACLFLTCWGIRQEYCLARRLPFFGCCLGHTGSVYVHGMCAIWYFYFAFILNFMASQRFRKNARGADILRLSFCPLGLGGTRNFQLDQYPLAL